MPEYLLASCNSSNKSATYCWNYTTGNVEHIYRSKCNSVCNSLCFLQNDYVITVEKDKPLIHVWPINSQEPKLRLVLPGNAEAICVDCSNTYLLVGIGTFLYIWMINSGDLLNIIEKNYQPISCVKVSNTTEHIVIGGKDGLLITYNFNSALSKSLTGQCEPSYTRSDHSDAITDVSIGCFGNKSHVVSVSLDRTCRLYNLNSGDPLKIFVCDYSLSSVILDVTSWSIYVADTCGTIKLIQIEDNTLTQHIEGDTDCFKGHFDKIISLDINSSNTVLATASNDCSIIIWDLKTRKQLRKMKQEEPPSSVRFLHAHSNIDLKVLKPQIVLKPLKRTVLKNVGDIEVTITQNVNIINKNSVNTPSSSSSTSNVNSTEVDKLKIINKQLYDLLIGIIQRTHGDNT